MAFASRAEAVYENARNLIIVEAEGTFFDFDLASEKLTLSKQQFDLSKDLQQRARMRPTTRRRRTNWCRPR